MKSNDDEIVKPAKIRITNYMQHGLNVPLPGPGKSVRGWVMIPRAKGDEPGVKVTDELDSVTVNRLRYHYDWRPTDPRNLGKKREEIPAEQIVKVGLLKIEILKEDDEDERPRRAPKPDDAKGQKAA